MDKGKVTKGSEKMNTSEILIKEVEKRVKLEIILLIKNLKEQNKNIDDVLKELEK